MTDGLSLHTASSRTSHAIREKVEKRAQEQRRSLMYLVAEYLRQQGLFKTCDALTEEARLTNNYEICDNVDLEIILAEYSDYYHARFNKSPLICRRVAASQAASQSESSNNAIKRKPKPLHAEQQQQQQLRDENPGELGLVVTPLSQKNSTVPGEANVGSAEEKMLRPLGNLYPAGSEWREIAETITREIVMTNLNVHWEDIYGLEDAKTALKEAVILPTKYPFLFNEKFTPWNGILLYGAPGTGKTMLAKAVATECNMTFFNITASSLVSKWRGDSEKYIRVLFELANHHAPSIIFIDEIDWIAAGDGANEFSDRSEPARRFRADLLSRLDGLMSDDKSRVVLLAATNNPWNLDSALLRRLEKHVHVKMPNSFTRKKIFQSFVSEHLHGHMNAFLGPSVDAYSCADVKRWCKDAWMMQIRPIWEKLENRNHSETKDSEPAIPALIEDSRCIEEAAIHIRPTTFNFDNKLRKWKSSFC